MHSNAALQIVHPTPGRDLATAEAAAAFHRALASFIGFGASRRHGGQTSISIRPSSTPRTGTSNTCLRESTHCGPAARPDVSGRVRPPACALTGVDRPQVAAIWTLQMNHRALVAQQVLPMCGAVRGALALAAASVGALGARQPCATARIGGWVNRQHDSPSDPAAHQR